MTTTIVAVLCALFGLPIGSFLNVVIWRVPRGESVVRPASRCPGCEQLIAPYDNVPVLSWLWLRGRCRRCATRISARYPIIEALTAGLFAAVGARFGVSIVVIPLVVLTAALIALCAIDIEHLLLPNRIVYPTGFMTIALFAVAAAVDHNWNAFGRAWLGATTCFAVLYGIWFIAPRAMGFGDVRLAFVLGFAAGWFSWTTVGLALFLPFLFGSLGGIAVAAPPVIVPMVAAAAVGYAFGEPVMEAYQGSAPSDPVRARIAVGAVAAVLVGSLVYLVLSAMRRVERGRHIPFGPSLALGAMVAIFLS